MLTVSRDRSDQRILGARDVSRARMTARRRPLRHRMAVVAVDPVEALQFTGGWVFDHSLAGWDVSVHVLEEGDPRPCEILGARVFQLQCSLERAEADPWPNALAISGTLLHSHERIRQGASAAMDAGRIDIRLWGNTIPTDLQAGTSPDAHQLSIAAQAFKRRAFDAASLNGNQVSDAEHFRLSHAVSLAPVPELIALGG
ncbi:hypothetical protein AAFP30_08710 [Gordonia sp. CPCC 205515]|uniref:hypothetical protein n=1 Tax=Gordonia sp. CPCC 205515 TaxID=3140791 RepID=UPI003AF384B6